MGPRRPVRVLQVISDTDRRGAQVFAADLQEALVDLSHRVRTVALHPGSSSARLDVPALGPSRRSLAGWRKLRAECRRMDVVVAHGSSTLVACASAMLGMTVPLVYRQISDPLFWAGTPMRRARVALYLRRVQKVVALSEDLAETVRAHYRLPVDRVVVIPNAVPAASFRPPSPEERVHARAALGLPGDAEVALYVGALANEKGVRDAVVAVVEVPGLHLLMVGQGPERVALSALGARAAPGRVHLPGPSEDVLTAYWASDVFLFPTRGGDSMPAAVIEAGLCGLPVVTTDVGAIDEIVVDGETGVILPPGVLGPAIAGVVERLVGDAGTRRRMGAAAAIRCASRFTISRVAPSWARLLAEVSGRDLSEPAAQA